MDTVTHVRKYRGKSLRLPWLTNFEYCIAIPTQELREMDSAVIGARFVTRNQDHDNCKNSETRGERENKKFVE